MFILSGTSDHLSEATSLTRDRSRQVVLPFGSGRFIVIVICEPFSAVSLMCVISGQMLRAVPYQWEDQWHKLKANKVAGSQMLFRGVDIGEGLVTDKICSDKCDCIPPPTCLAGAKRTSGCSQ